MSRTEPYVLEIAPYRLYAGIGWVVAAAALVVAIVLRVDALAWCTLLVAAAVATYHVTAHGRFIAQLQREAFELGRQNEARRRAEEQVKHIDSPRGGRP